MTTKLKGDLAIARGITLLAEAGSRNSVCAEHDIIYAGPDSFDDVSEETARELEDLGWFKDTESGRWAVYP